MKRLPAFLFSTALVLVVPAAGFAQDTLIDLGSKGTRISRAGRGARLAPPSGSPSGRRSRSSGSVRAPMASRAAADKPAA